MERSLLITRLTWPARAIRLVGIACGIGALLLLASCGDDGGPTGTISSPTPTPRLLQQGSLPLRAPEGDNVYFQLATVTDSSSGLWETTVDWTNQANALWMWVANGVCTADQFARADCPFDATCPCQFAIRSETATPKPRLLTIPGATGGTRTLIVMNLGPQADTATYRVTLTASSIVSEESALTSDTRSGSPSLVSSGRKSALRRR